MPPLFETAADYGVDPLDVFFALAEILDEERETLSAIISAREAARAAVGLYLNRRAARRVAPDWPTLGEWEDAGKDHTSWKSPGRVPFDVLARELAGAYPALGLGEGYSDGVDLDYAEPLWQVLRTPDPVLRTALEVLREAGERVLKVKGGCDAVPF